MSDDGAQWRSTLGGAATVDANWRGQRVKDGNRTKLRLLPAVERVLNAWRVPRARNERTGDVSHPSVVYVIGADGRIAYVVNGSRPVIRAAVEAL